MRTIVKGKNLDVPDNVRAYTERKLSRLERMLDDRSEALVELSIEQHRSQAHSHIVEVTLVIDGQHDPDPRRRRRRIARASTRSSTSSSAARSTIARSPGSGPGPIRRRPSSATSRTGPPSRRASAGS